MIKKTLELKTKEMNSCNLCNSKPADKTGSHIIPHFLLKRIFNIEGKSGRDYELGFTFSGIYINSHFGRSVPPEKLYEVYGDKLEDAIEKNKDQHVVDYFLCTECEGRLSEIETLYSGTLNKTSKTDYKSGVSGLNGLLFWVSIFWRMSVNGKNGVKLSENQNEILRSVLNAYLDNKPNDSLNKDSKHYELLKNISYKIIRCHDRRAEDSTWLNFHPGFYDLMCFIIDEYVVVLSLDGNFDELEKVDCFGINELLKNAPINTYKTNETIKPLNREVYQNIVGRMSSIQLNLLKSDLDILLDEIHKRCGGKGEKMPMMIKWEIFAKLTENKNLGNNFSREEIFNAINYVLSKYK